MKFLLDANISPETAQYLRRFNFNVKSLIEENLFHFEDSEVIKLAKKEKRIIITFDLDFGEIFYFLERRKVGIVVMRLDDQRVEKVNQILEKFIKYYKLNPKSTKFSKSLVILGEDSVRIING